MDCVRFGSIACLLGLLGCPRLADPADGLADEVDGSDSEITGSTASDESTAGSSSDSGSTDSGSTDSGSTDSTDSTDATDSSSTDSTETGGCEPGSSECPDGVCVSELIEFGCCPHGGLCPAGCEPQDADKGMGECPGAPEFAWTGEACKAVCPCQGSDCDAVYASPIDCFVAHSAACGPFDFSYCPFDEPVAAISITGQVPGESVDLQAGTFGLFFGKGSGNQLMLRFAADDVTLANHIAYPWSDLYLTNVLQIWAEPAIGVQEVTVTWGIPFETMALGTLTILDLEIMSPDSLDYFVTGTLEVSGTGWDLSGSFGLRHCNPLNLYAP